MKCSEKGFQKLKGAKLLFNNRKSTLIYKSISSNALKDIHFNILSTETRADKFPPNSITSQYLENKKFTSIKLFILFQF